MDKLTGKELFRIEAGADITKGLGEEIVRLNAENERLRDAIGNLEPLRDFDWHGKWRIQSCLEAAEQPNKDTV